ncbi:3832_t:CDS:2 [Paraglomus occultum]|uniref:3832_t:CDS:1 n=1 Tax=Paraglomus occultum TaxID=144539 RepID=A0A9N9G834_9GLOM|nr:3832_t:CDS:2 [Paraglomus occultum]
MLENMRKYRNHTTWLENATKNSRLQYWMELKAKIDMMSEPSPPQPPEDD